jgi:hypothetical protein
MVTRDRLVELDEATYGALEAAARRRQVAPDALANELVRERLAGEAVSDEMHRALAALAEFRAQVRQPVDAVALVREGRQELEERSLRWLSS